MVTDATTGLAGQALGGGRYVIEKPLGEGGMGSVWLATDSLMDHTQVVVKFPHAELLREEGYRERFQNEIRSLIHLSRKHPHPHIVKIFDVGEHKNTPYAVMEYLSGGSLHEWSKRLRAEDSRSLDLRGRLTWLEQVSGALDFAHLHDHVHRDVKPVNIMFDESNRAYLTDFGVVKMNTDRSLAMTGTGVGLGTMSYMAFEVLWGGTADGRADQYSLAVTLYEVLSGRLPYNGRTAPVLVEQQKNFQHRPLIELFPSVPQSLPLVIKKALHWDRDQRFDSCQNFASAILECFSPGGPRNAVRQQYARQVASLGDGIVEAEVIESPPPSAANVGTAALSSVKAETASTSMPAQGKPSSPAIPPLVSEKSHSGPSNPKAAPGIFSARTQPVASPHPFASGLGSGAGKSSPGITPLGGGAKRTPPPIPQAPASKGPMPSTLGPAPQPAGQAGGAPAQSKASGAKKQVVCPWCWHEFSPSEVLWIAEHHELVGDLKIAEGFHRFLPEKYTADCRAIDAMGTVCTRTACPNCHLIVPREFIDFEPIFVSVLGVPSSGKSCFLASMCWQLRSVLPQQFHYAFGDASTELNQSIIDNEMSLFLNNSDDLVTLKKTELEGDGYSRVLFAGREVTYLRPHVFALRPTPQHPNYHAANSISYALGIYDNAGEHFQPGADKNDLPVTRHLTASEAILFVFDPSQHPRFQQRCGGTTNDPQFQRGFRPTTVRQETVLVEAMDRIRRFGKLSSHGKLDKPLIVIVNKYDAWASTFDLKRLSSPWVKRSSPGFPASLDVGRISAVSTQIKGILESICPEVVAAAENMSSNVTYIPVSAFGRRTELVDGRLAGVRPNQINPMWIEVPLLHALGSIRRGVIHKV